jgi:hypothetical protein
LRAVHPQRARAPGGAPGMHRWFGGGAVLFSTPTPGAPVGVREFLNQQNPKVVVGATVGVILVVAAVLFLSHRSSGGSDTASAPARAFFTTDDGKTWFRDDARHLAPFAKDGKTAVRAYVYKCPDGREFVAFLERYTPDFRKKLEAANAGQLGGPLLDEASGTEVKPPGASAWVKQSDPRAMAVMTPKCPGGQAAQLVMP